MVRDQPSQTAEAVCLMRAMDQRRPPSQRILDYPLWHEQVAREYVPDNGTQLRNRVIDENAPDEARLNLAVLCCSHGGYGGCHETAHNKGWEGRLELYRRIAETYGAMVAPAEAEIVQFQVADLQNSLAKKVAATGDTFDPQGGPPNA